jgi:hypothetical protein
LVNHHDAPLQETRATVQKTAYIAAKETDRAGPMRIVYHLGAHCTDEDRLIRCLLKNRAVLAQQGIVVPPPNRYRTLLRDTAMQLKGQAASQDTQALVLDQVMDEDKAERLILSWDNFLSFPNWALKGTLYPAAGERVRAFAQVFPDIPAEFHLAIRNPATFLPPLFKRLKDRSYDDFMGGADPVLLRWSDVVGQIRAQNPDAALTLWCDEDTPLIWPEVLAAVSGMAAETVLEDADDLLAQIMTPDGMVRMRAYIAEKGPLTPDRRRRVVTAFLDKFAKSDEIEMDIAMPGWTAETVATMTQAYEVDVARIKAMPGITFIAP